MDAQTQPMDVPVASSYDFDSVESRWQQTWRDADSFSAPPEDERESVYVFAGCPFTSGDAHLGHIRSYTITDVYARYRRARGDAVLFSLGFDSFGLPAELEAIKRCIGPERWVDECCRRMRGQFERLGYSCDWDRTFVSSRPSHYRWTQWLFLAMMEAGFVYQHEGQVTWCDNCETVLASLQAEGGECWRCHGEVRFVKRSQWFIRTTAFLEDNEDGLDQLGEWNKAAIGSQRAILGRVDGVEIDAVALGVGDLIVFATHPDSIELGAFVAISPTHPDVDLFTAADGVAAQLEEVRQAGWRRTDRRVARTQVVDTGIQVSVPGVANLLPLVISPIVDGRLGPTAMLGIPAADETDAVLAEGLPEPAPNRFKFSTANSKPRKAVRFRARDFAISRQRSWGAPIPLIHCEVCGTVPVPHDDLPVTLPDNLQLTGEGNPLAARADFADCRCPDCGGSARRETDTIDCHVDGMWMWMPIAVPAADRDGSMFSHAEFQRWLPVQQIVWGADAGGYIFDQRLVAKFLQDIGELPQISGREPFRNALMHQMVRMDGQKMSKHLGNVVDPNDLVEEVGADVVRLAVLSAASPGRDFNWNEQPVVRCRNYLMDLWDYAEPRLRLWRHAPDAEIDETSRLRKRLAMWCRVGLDKVATNIEALAMQRATHNLMLMTERIRDFERRATEGNGELNSADRVAVTVALSNLLIALAPFAPHMAEELWQLGGHDTRLVDTPWPLS